MKKKVIIIGAGPAGLTAGYELLKRAEEEYEVIILEADNVVGGISRTVNYKGNRMDIGGHRFFSKNKDVVNFWKEILPLQGKKPFDYRITKRNVLTIKNGPNPDKENLVMLIRNRISRIYYLNKFFDYPISFKWQTFKNMGLVRTISAGCSYLKACIFKKKEDSLENFYINRFGKKLYGMFFEGYTEKLWGRHPKEISADWGAQRVKGLSILVVIKDMIKKVFHVKEKKIETSLIPEFYYPKYGPGQLWEEVSKKFTKMGGTIVKNALVSEFILESGNVKAVKANNIRYDGDIFISSMPLKDLIQCFNVDNNVDSNILRIANGLPYRDFITMGVLVDKLCIKNETNIKTLGNIVPDCWIYVQDERVKLLRLQIFNNWSPYMVKNPKKEVWVGAEYTCSCDDEFWKMTNKELKKFIENELVKIGIINMGDIKDYHIERIKKAYPSYFDTYYEMDKLVDYLNKFENLYCIGRNGQHRYNNMDHSMMTAFETVNNIINNVKDKKNIWNVNTEQVYHEKEINKG